jgi:formylglycine-generating enzyme required for sulfatase activity
MKTQIVVVCAALSLSLPSGSSTSCRADDDRAALLQTFVNELVEITPGTGEFPKSFQMGSGRTPAERPLHEVTFDYWFSIARYEVPQNLYEAVMGSNPSKWTGPRNSVEMMTWHEARTFCEKLTALLREAQLLDHNEVVRLPTEAEWEYCCRAGTQTAYSFGDKAQAEGDAGNQASILNEYGWHTGNAAGNDPPVGALKANPWGLYDMHGYLREFCEDEWYPIYDGAPTDGGARSTEHEDAAWVIVRGGSWKDEYDKLRSASRWACDPADKDDAVGFRCVKATRR